MVYSMRDIMDQMNNALEGKEPIHESAISDGALTRLVRAMVFNSRTQNLLSGIGIDETGMEDFAAKLVNPLKVLFSDMGIGVQSASAAKKDVRSSAR